MGYIAYRAAIDLRLVPTLPDHVVKLKLAKACPWCNHQHAAPSASLYRQHRRLDVLSGRRFAVSFISRCFFCLAGIDHLLELLLCLWQAGIRVGINSRPNLRLHGQGMVQSFGLQHCLDFLPVAKVSTGFVLRRLFLPLGDPSLYHKA
jgi:hypothetical protein